MGERNEPTSPLEEKPPHFILPISPPSCTMGSMPSLGKRATLSVLRIADHGLYLDAQNMGDVLLPNCFVPKGAGVGDSIDVFLYCDSADRLVASTQTPRAEVGEFASLQVVSVEERMGAFLDWGLNKDLLLPNREMEGRPRPGDWLVVFIRVDELSGRIVATQRIHKHLSKEFPPYREGEKVPLLILDRHDLGYTAIVAGAHKGLIYSTESRVELFIGKKLDGYVKKVREDGKIDLSLDPAGYTRVAPLADRILAELKAKGGRIMLCDESRPEDIRDLFGVSKKSFKQAIGMLFKARSIVMLEGGISLPIDQESTSEKSQNAGRDSSPAKAPLPYKLEKKWEKPTGPVRPKRAPDQKTTQRPTFKPTKPAGPSAT